MGIYILIKVLDSLLVSQAADRAQLTPNIFRLEPARSTSDPLELHSTDMCSTAPIKIHSRLILAGPELPLRHPRLPEQTAAAE